MTENSPGKTAPKDWKRPVYLVGGLLGLLTGLVSAYLYTRAAQETHGDKPPGSITTGDAFKVSLTMLSLLRQISDLALRR